MERNKERWNRRELGWLMDSENEKNRLAETGGTEGDESVNIRDTP